MKVHRYLFVVVAMVAAMLFTGCSSAPKYTRSGTPALYQYSAEPKRTDVSDASVDARRHAREMQRLQFEHEKRLATIEYTAKEAEVAREKGVAPAPAVNTSQTAPAAAPLAQVRWYTPNDPYGTGQPVPAQPQQVVRYVQPGFVQTVPGYEYRTDTGLSADQYWALRQYSLPPENGGYGVPYGYGYGAGQVWYGQYRTPAAPLSRIILGRGNNCPPGQRRQ